MIFNLFCESLVILKSKRLYNKEDCLTKNATNVMQINKLVIERQHLKKRKSFLKDSRDVDHITLEAFISFRTLLSLILLLVQQFFCVLIIKRRKVFPTSTSITYNNAFYYSFASFVCLINFVNNRYAILAIRHSSQHSLSINVKSIEFSLSSRAFYIYIQKFIIY